MIPTGPARRSFALIAALSVVASLVTMTTPAASAEECQPGQGGCMPTRGQCGTGQFNGYWSGGQTGRLVVCLARPGAIITYVGGTAVPPCGEIVVAGQVAVDGDANSCGGAGETQDLLTDQARSIGLDFCESGAFTAAPHVRFTTCAGEITSFDGVEIDARLTYPQEATGPLPLVTLLHGWSGDRRGTWQSEDEDPRLWGRARFISRGYATLVTTARGFWASCGTADQVSDADEVGGFSDAISGLSGGTINTLATASGGTDVTEEDPAQCLGGYTHIAERDFEVRDTQHLVGRLVDVGIAHPERLAVSGESYGGGQSWMLATAMPWDTPAEGEHLIGMAASVPMWGWTDLADALIPNGRATDQGPAIRSRETPIGVLKASLFGNLFRVGRARSPVVDTGTYASVEQGRYNTFKPDELHSFIDGWAVAFNKGEPYGSDAGDIVAAMRGKSAIYTSEFFDSVARGETEPVPVFALQGWSDALFPAVQGLQMYDRMKEIHPRYPITIALGHFGHVSDPSTDQLRAAYDLAGAFIDEHLLVAEPSHPEEEDDEDARPSIYSFETTCDGGLDEPITARRWKTLPASVLALSSTEPGATSSGVVDAERGAATDPVLAGPIGGKQACLTQDGPTEGAARWQWQTYEDELLLGLPVLTAGYALSGSDATVVAKLWDIAPNGDRTLVTRGVYRISTTSGDPQNGTLGFKLFGNHWTFAQGHTIELELSQTDAPFLRPNQLYSEIVFTDVMLEMPRPRPSGSAAQD